MNKILITLTLCVLSVLAIGQAPMLDGTVTCPDNQPLEGVSIVVEHAVTFASDSTLTNPNGYFSFDELPGEDEGPYLIRASYASSHIGGISTLDMVIITQHLLLINPLSGYNLRAGDYDQSGTVSARDLVLLRKIILAMDPEANLYPPQWRFWLNFSELPYTIDQINAPLTLGLVATKTGDVNTTGCN
jgi:hypothetical protein